MTSLVEEGIRGGRTQDRWMLAVQRAMELGVDADQATVVAALAVELGLERPAQLQRCADGADVCLQLTCRYRRADDQLSALVQDLGYRLWPTANGWRLELPTRHGDTTSPNTSPARQLLEQAAARTRAQRANRQLSAELEETNRGVVALHRELEQRAEEASAAARVRDELLSIASHDLRSPMAALQVRLQLINRRLRQAGRSEDDPLVGWLGQQARAAEQQTLRLSRLMEDLLDITRISAGHIELQEEEVDLSAVVWEVAEECRNSHADSPAVLTVDAPTRLPGRWDRLRLEQILANLIGNAFKYGEGAPIQVRARAENGSCVLEVADQGPGIDPERQDRIFRRFEQVRRGRPSGGVGLGLWIVQRVTEAMGGSLTLSSERGKGARFILRLPRNAEPISAP